MTGNETVNLFTFKGLNEEIRNMTKNSKIAGLVLGSIFAATALTAANDAMALEVRQCGTSEAIRAELRAEGQVPLIVAYRSVPTRPKNYFSTNADLSLGYQFEEQNGQMCIAAKYRDIRLNNDSNVVFPAWAGIAPNSSAFNNFINTEYNRAGARVIFAAIALGADANGVERPVSKLVVTMGNGDQFVANRGTTVAGYNNGGYGIAMNLEDIVPQANFGRLASIQNTPPTTVLASNNPK